MVYLDHNAATPMRAEALEALAAAARVGGNPSSLHAAGQSARRRLDDAADAIRQLVGAFDAEVLLTSGGTEADNLALRGLARRRREASGARRVLLSALEHPAVRASAERLAEDGFAIEELPLGRDGRVELGSASLGEDVAVVALMLANNETGILQPVAELAARAREHGVPVHTDAVQGAGKIPIDFDALGVTTLALSAHKFGGPRGIGALVTRKGTDLSPMWLGGGQQQGLRPGTEAVALAAGMAAAALAARAALDDRHRGGLRDTLERSLAALPGSFVVGADSPRLPNTLAMGFDGVPAIALLERLDAAGIMVSAGAACHAGVAEPSAVLLAMGLSPERAALVVRLSLGWNTTAEDIAHAAEVIGRAVSELRG